LISSLLQKDVRFRITPTQFFRQLIPDYEPLKRNILEVELLDKIAEDYFKGEPYTQLGLYLKAIVRIDRIVTRLNDEWYDIRSYLATLRQVYYDKALEIKAGTARARNIQGVSVVCVEKRIYDLLLYIIVRGIQCEKRGRYKSLRASANAINLAIQDYALSIKLIKILKCEAWYYQEDWEFLQSLDRRIRMRLEPEI
jgi:hypothetical protein